MAGQGAGQDIWVSNPCALTCPRLRLRGKLRAYTVLMSVLGTWQPGSPHDAGWAEAGVSLARSLGASC